MDARRFFLKDSNSKASATLTAFALGFLVVNVKLIFSGVEVSGFKFSDFTGSDYAMAVGALGAIYVMRRTTDHELKAKAKALNTPSQEGGE